LTKGTANTMPDPIGGLPLRCSDWNVNLH
jgi:hypothetical protein